MLIKHKKRHWLKQLAKSLLVALGYGLSIPVIAQDTITIHQTFQHQLLNTHLLLSTRFRHQDLKRAHLTDYILQTFKAVPNQPQHIMLGHYKNTPDGWFYISITNADSTLKELVLLEIFKHRCDALEAYLIEHDSISYVGRTGRAIPLAQRPLPVFANALPFYLYPKKTVGLLIHTQRTYSFHEVTFQLFDKHPFWAGYQLEFISQISTFVILTICILVMLIVGYLFRDTYMLALSLLQVLFLFLALANFGVTDVFSFPTSIGLGANCLIAFLVFASNATYHLFGNQIMKDVPKNEKVFNSIARTLAATNFLLAMLFFLPKSLFVQIDPIFPTLAAIMSPLAIAWVFYSTFLMMTRTQQYYLFVIVVLGLAPLFFTEIMGYLRYKDIIFMPMTHWASSLIAYLSVSAISVFRLRNELISKKKHHQNVLDLRHSMEEIRRSEITNIGRNLHDNVGNMLASALGYLNLKTTDANSIKKLLLESINEVRFLSHNLVKDEETPIVEKIENLVQRFNDFSSVQFHFNDYTEEKLNLLDTLRQQNLYMIIQEIMTNIVKHSQAQEAFIQVFKNENLIVMNVEDDGIGIDKRHTAKGVGLANMYKRATLSQFKLTLDSTSQGTNFIIEFQL